MLQTLTLEQIDQVLRERRSERGTISARLAELQAALPQAEANAVEAGALVIIEDTPAARKAADKARAERAALQTEVTQVSAQLAELEMALQMIGAQRPTAQARETTEQARVLLDQFKSIIQRLEDCQYNAPDLWADLVTTRARYLRAREQGTMPPPSDLPAQFPDVLKVLRSRLVAMVGPQLLKELLLDGPTYNHTEPAATLWAALKLPEPE